MAIQTRVALRPFGLNQWWYVAAMLIILTLVLGLVFQYGIYSWYLQEFIEPKLEISLGFRGGILRIEDDSGSHNVYAVVAVSPGGVFERAGVRPGDIPDGYSHGVRSGFVNHIFDSRGGVARLRFVGEADARRGNWQSRRVEVPVPRNSEQPGRSFTE